MYKSAARFYQKHRGLVRAADMTKRPPRRRVRKKNFIAGPIKRKKKRVWAHVSKRRRALVTCEVCGCQVRNDRLKHHRRKVHARPKLSRVTVGARTVQCGPGPQRGTAGNVEVHRCPAPNTLIAATRANYLPPEGSARDAVGLGEADSKQVRRGHRLRFPSTPADSARRAGEARLKG